MTAEEKEYIQFKAENEGFDYCFVNYSSFEEIKDEDFHILRRNYVAAQEALAKYIGLYD